ncbi:hypothetical protein [Catellatospora methionotrophica]|uniref:hypothetical protein n=1 Tax=Catellatospora methionotrophica TaxID=121620 RepID=UPI0033F74AD5
MVKPPSTKRIGRNRLELVMLYQAHALDHADNRGAVSVLGIPTDAICNSGLPNPPARTTLRCPLCRGVFEFGKMTEEHVPPRGLQSSLTPDGPRVVVLTCENCNETAGHSFEGDASEAMQLDEFDVPEYACGVHGHRRLEHLPSGLLVLSSDLPFAMTDFKAGFLIAFATLGHRWAMDPALDPVRAVIASYTAPDRNHGYLARIRNPAKQDFVYEVRTPQPCTIVHAANGTAVVLPLPGHPTVPTQLDGVNVGMRTYRWPDMYAEQPSRKPNKPPRKGHHSLVTDAMAAGYLFHGDICVGHRWADPAA